MYSSTNGRTFIGFDTGFSVEAGFRTSMGTRTERRPPMTADRTDPIYTSGDRRTADSTHEHEAFYDFFVDFIQGGLAQFALLSAPMLWVVAQTPVYTVEIATAAGVSLLLVSFLITLFRGGHVSVGRPWPVLSNGRLGTGAGWRAFLTRSVYLSCTLSLATYGGVLAQVVSGSFVWNVGIAVVLGIVGLVLLPYLSVDSTRMRIARLGYCLLGLVPAIVVLLLFASESLDPSAAFALLVVCALAALDSRPLLDAVRR